jgi:hypothetical protein
MMLARTFLGNFEAGVAHITLTIEVPVRKDSALFIAQDLYFRRRRELRSFVLLFY